MIKVISSANIKKDLCERLESQFPTVTFKFFRCIEEAKEELVDANILMTYGEDLTPETIATMQKLKWIMVISAGIDQLPFTALAERGIVVTNARGIHKTPMAEYTMAMILQIARQTKVLIEHEQQHIWNRRIPMTEIHGKTLGILGAGAIGSEISKYAKVFSMKTIGMNQNGRQTAHFDKMVAMETMKYLIEESDFIVSVLPSTPKTDRLINKEFFKAMKDTAVFINIGRGKNVVEADLIAALQTGEFAHAVLDVFEQEPLPKDHPFWSMNNVTITPHLSGISPMYQQRALEIFQHNLTMYVEGRNELLNIIDLKRGY